MFVKGNSYAAVKARRNGARTKKTGISLAFITSKRRKASPRKLEPHEVIAKLKARKTGVPA